MVESARRVSAGPGASMLARRQSRLLRRTLDQARRLDGYKADLAAISDTLDPFETLNRMPILTRATIQERPRAFRDLSVRSLLLTSSGSTGTPLEVHLHPRTRWRRRRQFAAFFGRNGWRPWHRAVSIKVLPDPSARLGSTTLDRTALGRRRSISALEPIEQQLETIRAVDPEVIHGLPTIIAELAVRARAEGWRPTGLRRVFTVSEAMTPATRSEIEEGLGGRVVDLYAAVEGFVGWECRRRDGFHIHTSNVVVEVVGDDGAPTPPGEVGRVILTTLDNPAMPLVRYAIGDMAVAGDGRHCPCGHSAPLLPRVLGRRVPLLEIGGEHVSPWGVLARMHELDFVQQFQLVQPAGNELHARILARPDQHVDRAAVSRLIAEELPGLMSIEVSEVEEFARLPSGKAMPALAEPTFPTPSA